MKCTGTAYILDLSVIIFSATRALTKGFNVTSEKESLVLNKNATVLKFIEILYNGNSDGYLLAARLYSIPNDAEKYTREGGIHKGKKSWRWKGRQ